MFDLILFNALHTFILQKCFDYMFTLYKFNIKIILRTCLVCFGFYGNTIVLYSSYGLLYQHLTLQAPPNHAPSHVQHCPNFHLSKCLSYIQHLVQKFLSSLIDLVSFRITLFFAKCTFPKPLCDIELSL